MLLAGLDNIDFSGIGSLGEIAMSKAELIGMAAPILSQIPFDSDQVDTLFNAISSKYRFVKNADVPATKEEGDQFSSDMEGFTRKALSWSQIGEAATSGDFRKKLENTFRSLAASWSSQGIAVVPLQRSVSSGSPSAGSQAATPGPQASYTAPRSQTTNYQGAQQSSMSAGAGVAPSPGVQRNSLPVRHITRAHTQTPQERKRLLLIAGGFAVVFIVALGVVAIRD